MRSVTFLIKPASSLCDLRCRYCFYADISDLRQEKNMGIMTDDTARQLISRAVDAVSPMGHIQFMFQGGEPTLAGLGFFQRFIGLEREFSRPGIQFSHAIQTNGMHINREWAKLFKEQDFLVGLSVDGAQYIHDSLRVGSAGRGTWDRATQALALLDQYNVETNLLCVVSASIAKNPQKVYKSLRALGQHPLQFIPCLDPIEDVRGQEFYSLTPQAYGKFLCGLFDCFYRDWKQGNYTSIRTFDDYIRILTGMPSSSCAASGSCGNYLVVEGNGNLYPCDFYVLDEWKIGNIREFSVQEALNNPISQQFIQDSHIRPEECNSCTYKNICRGGCKRDWTPQRQNYYCPSFAQFFSYALPRLQEMANYLRYNTNSL